MRNSKCGSYFFFFVDGEAALRRSLTMRSATLELALRPKRLFLASEAHSIR
jgi:hypothetical protein